jgi:cell division protein FtsZ
MGAVIGESLQGQVEVCVLGTTELGGRNFTRPAAVPARRPERRPAPAAAATPAGEGAPAAKASAGPAAADPHKPLQEEFGFGGGPVENRGSFDKSDRNLFEGQDLDVPTYLRRGIKITV